MKVMKGWKETRHAFIGGRDMKGLGGDKEDRRMMIQQYSIF